MSIQSKIDYHLSKEGGHQYNIVIKNENGPMKLPKGVNVSLFDCIIDSIDATEGENSIFIGGGQSKVLGLVDQHNGNFGAENTLFLGEIFWRKNTRVKLVKDSTFFFRVNAHENTLVDIFNCKWDGFGSYAFRGLDHCRITISKSLITKRTKGAWAEKGSVFDLNSCTVATATGLYLVDNAQINMVGGNLKPTTIGIDAKNKCQIYLAQLDSPISVPSDYDVIMEEWCKLTAHGTDMQNAKTAIQAKKFCTIDVMDFNFLKSTGNDCIILDEYTTARFVDGKSTIESEGASAISAKDHSTVNCVDVKMVEGKGKDGVVLQDNHSKFEATGKGGGIIKGVKAGIRATNKCTVSVDNHQQVKGLGEDGVVLNNDCQAFFSKVQELVSDGANGAKLSNESDISFQDHQTIKGSGGNGIQADNNCSVNLQTVQSVIGVAGDGIKVSKNTEVDIIYTDLIQGKSGIGINASDNCDVYVNRSNKVTGLSGGIKNTSNGSLIIELLNQIAPESGFGIRTENQVDSKLSLITKILYGVTFVDSTTQMKSCSSVQNVGGSPAVDVTGGEIDIQKITAEKVQIHNGFLRAASTEFSSIDATYSEVELTGVTLSGAVSMTGTVFKARRVSGQALTLASSAADISGGGFSSIAVDDSSTALLMNTGGSVSGTGNVIAMNSGAVAPGMNRITMGNETIAIINKLNASIQEAGPNIIIDTTASGGTIEELT